MADTVTTNRVACGAAWMYASSAANCDPVSCPAAAAVPTRFDEIVKGLTPFLKQCGYNPKKDLTFIPISALSGHNVEKRAPAEVGLEKGGLSFVVVWGAGVIGLA